MPVALSLLRENVQQPDGRRFVRERHTLGDGRVEEFAYLCDGGDDPAALMAARVPVINAGLKRDEIDDNATSLAPTFVDSDRLDLLARLRREFKEAQGLRLHQIAKFLDANYTNPELRVAFDLTVVTITTFRTKLQAMAARLDALFGEPTQ